MKIYGLLLVVAILFASQQFTKALDQKIMEECIKDAEVSDADAKMIRDKKLKEMNQTSFSPNMKCFIACLYKKTGVIDAGGIPVPPKLKTFMEERYKDKKDKVLPALMKCATIKDANPCEMVNKFEICMSENIAA